MDRPRTPRLSLDLLRGFRAAARHLSFTKAASDLFVTQSAISQEVKALEEQLGTLLFSRVNRTLRLTEAGEKLYRAADDALSTIDAVAAEVSGAGHALAITTTVPLASLWLGPRLPGFTRLHPEIGLRLVASNDTLDVTRQHIDVAIRHVPRGDAAASALKLFDHEVFPVCVPTLPDGRAAPIRTAQDLSNHVLLDFETIRDGRPWYDWQLWLRAMQIRGLKPAGWLRYSHYDQVIAAVMAGSGVAIGKWPHLERHLHDGTLVAPLGDAGIAVIGAFYVVVGHQARNKAVASFVDWLRNEADQTQRRHHAHGGVAGAGRRRPEKRRAGAQRG